MSSKQSTKAESNKVIVSPIEIPASEDTPLKSIRLQKTLKNDGLINTKVFNTLVAAGDRELVRALTANVLNALEEGFRQGKYSYEKQDLIGIGSSSVKLIPRAKAIGFRKVAESLTILVNFIIKETTPPPTAASKDGSKPATLKLPGTPAQRQKKFEKDLKQALKLMKIAEKETKRVEDLMLRYNEEAGLDAAKLADSDNDDEQVEAEDEGKEDEDEDEEMEENEEEEEEEE